MKNIWFFHDCLDVKKFIANFPEVSRRDIASTVLQQFQSNVFEKAENFQKGITLFPFDYLSFFFAGQIHGDFNENNLLVKIGANGKPAEEICGVLDLWDTHKSFLVFDVAVAVTYAMILPVTSVPLFDVGAHILAGYLAQR